MFKFLVLALNVFVIIVYILLDRKARDDFGWIVLPIMSKNMDIKKVESANQLILVNNYVKKIREFLKYGHDRTQNMSDFEWNLMVELDQAIQSGKNLSSFVEVLPTYDRTTYKELIKVSWFSYDEYQKWPTPPESFRNFARAFHIHDHVHIEELIEMAFYFLAKHEIEFMISDGTLIGSLRHFDQVPWDDDFDIIIRHRDKDKIVESIQNQRIFSDLAIVNFTTIFKLFHKSTKEAGSRPWNFPFIDFFPSDENATHLNREFYGSYYNASKKSIYPLVLRPIGKYWLPAPRDGEAFENQIGFSNIFEDCSTGTFSHRLERSRINDFVDCRDLADFYPLTQRICKNMNDTNVCMESLELVDKTIHLFYFDSRPIVLHLQ